MKNKKKTILFLGAVIAAFLMVSSTTAVNVSQSEAVEEQMPTSVDEKQVKEKNVKEEEETDTDCPLCAEGKLKNLDLVKTELSDGSILCFLIGLLFCILVCGDDGNCGSACGQSVAVICLDQVPP